jgi:hypothetical protein
VFQPLAVPEKVEEHFTYAPKGTKAAGNLTDEGFLVFAGSSASVDESPSTSDWVRGKRKQLLDSGVLKPDGEVLKFAQDYLFNSPSAAAAVVRGHNVNGWDAWKDSNGRSLDEHFRSTD